MVPRRRDATVNAPAIRRHAVVPSRGDNDDPRVDGAVHRLAQGIVPVGLQHGRAERQVDDADVVLTLVIDRPVDGFDHIARHTRPVVSKHPQAHDVRARRNAAIRRRLRRPTRAPGDRRRHVRAVAIPVHAVAAGKVHRRDHPVPERHVPRVHTRVDHRHANTRAVQRREPAGAFPDLIGADRLRCHIRRRTDGRVGRDVLLRPIVLDRRQLPPRDPQHCTAPQVTLDPHVVARGQRLDLGLRAAHDDVHTGRARRHVLRQVGAEPRAAPLLGGSVLGQHERQRDDRGGGEGAAKEGAVNHGWAPVSKVFFEGLSR